MFFLTLTTGQSSPLSSTDNLLLYFSNLRVQRHFLITLLLRPQELGSVPGKPWKTILSPAAAPAGGSRISTLSGEQAHMTMAWDTTPLILAGFRLQSRMAMRFCICTRNRKTHLYSSEGEKNRTEPSHGALEMWFTWSRGMCLTRPLTTVLGEGSPTSTCSTYRLSASGCFSAVIIRPTRRSRRDTSTLASSGLGVACFFSALSPPYAEQKDHQPGFGGVKSIFSLFKKMKMLGGGGVGEDNGNNIEHLSGIRLNFPP